MFSVNNKKLNDLLINVYLKFIYKGINKYCFVYFL